jgi:DNA-binding NarL/FixJ family response regulator
MMTSFPSPHPQVLLVDDDIRYRKALKRALEAEGVEVVGEARNGRVALWAARVLRPDVAVMDLRMPEVGGIEATRRIRAELPSTQVIILTVYDEPLPTRSALDEGAFAYAVKGCSAHLIADIVRAAWRHERESDAGTPPGA